MPQIVMEPEALVVLVLFAGAALGLSIAALILACIAYFRTGSKVSR